MTHGLQAKVIWITGAMGLIGRAATGKFLEQGARVVATDILDAGGFPVMREHKRRYGECLTTLVSDATDEAQVQEASRRIKAAYGRLDGLFHTSYAQIWNSVQNATLAEWESVTRGTLTSTFLVNKYACELMIGSGGGSIVNTSSALANVILPDSPAAYAAAKAGVNQFTRIVAAEYGKYGIRANAILPGDIKAADHPDQNMNNWFGRSGRPEEVADLASFLLSDVSSYISGSLYSIDGGFGL